MKELNLYELKSDPLTEAKFKADCETIIIAGFIKDSDKESISICTDRNNRSYTEYPQDSVIAAFETDEDEVLFVIKKDAQVRNISHSKAQGNDCGCSIAGDQTAIRNVFLSRPNDNGGYGQGCFYDCMDEHIGHGDDPDSAGLHKHCENKCSISMPALVARNPRFLTY